MLAGQLDIPVPGTGDKAILAKARDCTRAVCQDARHCPRFQGISCCVNTKELLCTERKAYAWSLK
jgi:hypothetical protein